MRAIFYGYALIKSTVMLTLCSTVMRECHREPRIHVRKFYPRFIQSKKWKVLPTLKGTSLSQPNVTFQFLSLLYLSTSRSIFSLQCFIIFPIYFLHFLIILSLTFSLQISIPLTLSFVLLRYFSSVFLSIFFLHFLTLFSHFYVLFRLSLSTFT